VLPAHVTVLPHTISPGHPLRRLFRGLTSRRLAEVGWSDTDTAGYLGDLLTDFVHVDNLYRVRGARGRRLETVAEMLVEGSPLLGPGGFSREREVRRHIGDFTLFFTGVFPELTESLRIRRRLGADLFVDYVAAGRESYRKVAEFDRFHGLPLAPVFARLADRFEVAVVALHRVREDLDVAQRGMLGRVHEILGS
jgi:hypothetical protein